MRGSSDHHPRRAHGSGHQHRQGPARPQEQIGGDRYDRRALREGASRGQAVVRGVARADAQWTVPQAHAGRSTKIYWKLSFLSFALCGHNHWTRSRERYNPEAAPFSTEGRWEPSPVRDWCGEIEDFSHAKSETFRCVLTCLKSCARSGKQEVLADWWVRFPHGAPFPPHI